MALSGRNLGPTHHHTGDKHDMADDHGTYYIIDGIRHYDLDNTWHRAGFHAAIDEYLIDKSDEHEPGERFFAARLFDDVTGEFVGRTVYLGVDRS